MADGLTAKIAVSLPDELVARARHAVERGEAASVSAFVATALERHIRDEDLAELVATLLAEEGAPSEADYLWASQALGLE